MHILITTDQPLSSLGGVQVSIRLQRRFLRAAGHRVTVVAPRSRVAEQAADEIALPSVPITSDREYGASWPGRAADRRIDQALADAPPVDIVHVQGDYWGAITGYRFAERHGVPVVLTAHNNLDFGVRQVMPFPGIVFRALGLAQRSTLGPRRSTLAPSAESILNEYARRSAAVTAPSSHFARTLESTAVADQVEVVWNGVDDALVTEIRDRIPRRSHDRPVFLWTGRMSAEKRFLEFLEAVTVADLDAEYRIYGRGLQLSKGSSLIARYRARGGRSDVRFMGKVDYGQSLAGIRSADALVQTSIGFETQGMTVFEAAALGTPSIVSDPRIAADLPAGTHVVPADGSVAALADALTDAARRISGDAWISVPEVASERVLQSEQTEQMLRIYRRVRAEWADESHDGAVHDR